MNLRDWRFQDPRTGAVTDYQANTPYSGPIGNPYLMDPKGPDGKGPCVGEEPATPDAEKSTPAPSSDSSNKEK